MAFTIEAQQFVLTFNHGLDVNGSAPQLENVLESIPRVIEPEIDAIVTVLQHKFPAVFEVAVDNLNNGLPKVRQPREQFLFNALPVSVGDFVPSAFCVVAVDEELVFVAELLGEEGIDEGDVVVDAASLENLVPAESRMAIPVSLGCPVFTLVVFFAELALVPSILDVLP